MSDAEGMKTRVIGAVMRSNPKDLDKAIDEIWHDGYDHGFEHGYDKARERAELK